MIPALRYAGHTVAVVGLGKSGMSAARALTASGARVLCWDDGAEARARAAAEGLTVSEPSEAAWATVGCVVWSPGIPHTHPQPHPAAELARRLHRPLVCDVDLLCETQPDCFYVGITGTNGKSTTTALIAHILKSAGLQAEAGGNIGAPALDMPAFNFTGTYILELSSYQLELVPHLSCDVAVWLNVTPDHLARHGGLEGYVAAKEHIFATPKTPATAIIGVDDAPSRAVFDRVAQNGRHRMVPVSVERAVTGGVYVQDGQLIDATGKRPRTICTLDRFDRLRGAHNWQNIACAYAAASARHVPAERILEAIASFPGLPHRQQQVAVIEDVAFINDSKATNAEAAAKALGCYDNILWIAGGQAKEGGITSLEPFFPRIKHAFLIGEAAADFARVLDGKVPYTLAGTLENAVDAADEMADRGDTVLLSPACASWDQFKSFEHRGEVFARVVAELAEDDGEDHDADETDGEDEA